MPYFAGMSKIPQFTEALQDVFLAELKASCNVTVAAETAGVAASTVYAHRKHDPLFAERWDEALQEGIDLLEHEAHRRAFRGVEEPVVYQGQFSYEYEYDDQGRLVWEDLWETDPKTGEERTTRQPKLRIDARTGRPAVKTVRKYSDPMAMFLLKAHRPAKYRENSSLELTGKNGGPVQFSESERVTAIGKLLALARLRKEGEDSGLV